MIDDATLAYLDWLAKEELSIQKQIVLARRYHEGDHDTHLSPRAKEFLDAKDDHSFNLNLTRIVVDAISERLIIKGMGSTEPEDQDNPDQSRPLAEWADQLYDLWNMEVLQASVHEGCPRDGEYFVIVDWDEEKQRPVPYLHHRYTDPTADGDGFGCKAHYPDDDTNQDMLFASKRWTERINDRESRQRMTLYYPERVEKYHLVANVWVEFQDEGDAAWPIPWVDSGGQPLGIPAIHFKNTPDLRPEAWDAIPPQRSINKVALDLLAASDFAGFKLLVAFGWIPTSDGKALDSEGANAANVKPGTFIGTTKSKTEAGIEAIDGANLKDLIEAVQAFVGYLAIVSNTPESRVSFTRQIAAEGTLQEQNEGLFAKVRKRRTMIGQAWVQCFEMARRLQNEFGTEKVTEDHEFEILWEPVQSRDTEDERDEWRAKKELGVPLETLWQEMGYTPEQIEAMKDTAEYRARMELMSVGMGGDEG